MPLLEFLRSSPAAVAQMSLVQIISACGDGQLRDGNECCNEFREYLRSVSSSRLGSLVETCLVPGAKLGFALQDLVNEIGRRLDLTIEHGRYQGVQAEIGFDGIWRSRTGHSIVVEVKTTDAYRINLDTVASYRQRLIDDARVGRESSILLVVLREDTGDLEAQVRGSRHAWDIRIISVDALLKVLQVKERTESSTQAQIEQLLVPFEYTRIDRIIDITFAAVMDVEEDVQEVLQETHPVAEQELDFTYTQDRTPTKTLEAARRAAVDQGGRATGKQFVKRSRAKYESADGEARLVCAVSKVYPDGGLWYGYHPEQDTFLSGAANGFYAIVGVGMEGMFLIPRDWLAAQLDHLWTTEKPDRMYWHIVVRPSAAGWNLHRQRMEPIPLDPYWHTFACRD